MRRVTKGLPTARERSAGKRVQQMFLQNIKKFVKKAPVIGITASTSLGGYTPFKAAQPGKLNLPFGGKKKIMDIGGGGRGAGGGPAHPPLGGGTSARPEIPVYTVPSMRSLGRRYARTGQGKRVISAAQVTAGVVAGGVVGHLADDIIDHLFQQASSRMGSGVQVSNTQFNPSVSNKGVGVYFRNKLISLLTEEQYDQFWRNAATHIRKHLKAL